MGALLQHELCESGDLTAACRKNPRLLGNEVTPGDVIFVAGGGGVELAEATSVLGVDVRVALLGRVNRVLTEVPATVGVPVLARRDATDDWQPVVIIGLGS